MLIFWLYFIETKVGNIFCASVITLALQVNNTLMCFQQYVSWLY